MLRTRHRATRLAPVIRILAGDGAEVCTRCEVPSSALARMRGLLGRDGLEPEAGMLINASPSVHTFFMRFPIDVVFLDKDKTIVRIAHSVRPWRTAGARGAAAALELPAGTAAERGLAAGDTLSFVPLDA